MKVIPQRAARAAQRRAVSARHFEHTSFNPLIAVFIYLAASAECAGPINRTNRSRKVNESDSTARHHRRGGRRGERRVQIEICSIFYCLSAAAHLKYMRPIGMVMGVTWC